MVAQDSVMVTPFDATSDQLLATGRKLLINNYGRAPIVMSHGEGCVLWDVDGAATST
jgi:acetylornithine/succinyldiaminopimelate/putrescine aminotransferase